MSNPESGAKPAVTVVTVTFNGADLVLDCLAGLERQDLRGRRMEVMVVDNSSTDGTADFVARAHPNVLLVRSDTNLGFAGGNNLAFRQANSPYVILLNNDAVPEPGFVRALADAMDVAAPEVAGMTATVLLADLFREATENDARADRVVGTEGQYVRDPTGPVALVNSTGNEVRSDGYGVDRGWLADAALHKPPREVFGFCGAAAILRLSALQDVGLFDEDFFLYYEDSDLSWRLRLAGYRIEHCSGAVVRHIHAASTGEGSELFRFFDGRNRMLMLTKNASALLAIRAVARYLLTTASVAGHRSQTWPQIRTRLRVIVSFFRLLPAMLGKRRAVGRNARCTRAEVELLLVKPPATATGSYRS